ncbi:uncharacterized protein LOC121374800 [Gigantopelta aegis]|uniref:uncharacterized protein LOC121374800 n=1 Tax=Gigantopelta aegis TaxID=1735272 RepID=UPI001B887D75|nr:uncharacterized protein LOC121374800 [Gigantopelta aegis]
MLLIQLTNHRRTKTQISFHHTPNSPKRVKTVSDLRCGHGKQIDLGKIPAYSAWTQRTLVAMDWQTADKNCDFYLYSAYRDQIAWKIRIMGLSRRLNGSVSIRCYIWKTRATRKPEISVGDIKYISGGKNRYTGTITSCPVKKGQRPFAVSVTVNDFKNVTNIIEVRYPDRKRTDITVCIPVVHSNFRETNKTISIIETNRLLGAQRFVIYYSSASPDVNTILDTYVNDGLLEIVNWALPVRNAHYYGQDVVNNDCLYRNMFVSRYIMFADLDEVIMPKKHADLRSYIKSVERKFPNVGSLLFQNAFFCTNSEWKPDTDGLSNSADVQKYDVTPLLRIRRDKTEFPWKRRSKQIVISERVSAVRIHLIDKDMYRAGFKVHLVSPDDGLLHHYRFCRGVTETARDDRVRIHSDQLLANVKHRHLTIKHET